MSFQLSTATALPAEVQLAKEKPQGAFALRTRYALSANSANSWLANSLCSLPLQTGTPGTFTDVKQGTINCTLEILNTNPYVDFINFGPCGAIIFFDEMRVYSSGTPIEENLRYSETVDLLMMQGGWQCKPYHVYRRNKWRAANGRAGDKHINFIKPSMVDAFGVPMFGRSPFMDNNSAVYTPPSIALGLASNTNQLQGVDFAYNQLAIPGFISGSTVPSRSAILGQIVGVDAAAPFYDHYSLPLTTTKNTLDGQTQDIYGETDSSLIGRSASKLSIPTNSTVNKAGVQSIFKNTQVGRSAPSLSQQVLANGTHLPVAAYVPSQWPDYQPCTLSGEVDDEEVDMIIGKSKVSEYMKYLANVRSLPIGVKGAVAANGYQASGNELLAGAAEARSRTEYRVSMPFLSGIYGVLADKMFPDLLIGANNMRIEFKLASNQKAFWLTMDPCRRVPGTVRDFVPFTGAANGQARAPVVGGGLACFGYPSSGATLLSAFGCEFSGVYLGLSSSATSVANSGSSGGGVGGIAIAAGDGGAIIESSSMYTTASALGEDVTAMQFSLAVGANQGTDNAVNNFGVDLNAKSGVHLSPFTNLPKPQYIPSSAPWARKAISATADYVNERAICYGTYLPASVPQTRRTHVSSRLDVQDAFSGFGEVTFAIRDLQYIGEQVQLDDLSASALINQAASSEIVVWSKGYRSFEANTTIGEQQNIILPIQIGQATALYLLFRPEQQIQSTDYYSNSYVCPFTGLSFTSLIESATTAGAGYAIPVAGQRPDVGGRYAISSSLDTSSMGSFSYQLFSGAKQYPLQPIQTVTELLAEREKSTHSLHNWSWCSTENMQLTRWDQPSASGVANSSGLQFDPFLDLGYFTTFVPSAALDDQTITQNPHFSLAEVSASYTFNTAATPVVTASSVTSNPRIRGRREPSSLSVASATTYTGVLNQFVPPIGTFFLGWDFESWTNHDDVMRTGKFLGQEQLSVRMTGTKLMNSTIMSSVGSNAVSLNQIKVLAIVPHIVKLSFVPGGHVLSYY